MDATTTLAPSATGTAAMDGTQTPTTNVGQLPIPAELSANAAVNSAAGQSQATQAIEPAESASAAVRTGRIRSLKFTPDDFHFGRSNNPAESTGSKKPLTLTIDVPASVEFGTESEAIELHGIARRMIATLRQNYDSSKPTDALMSLAVAGQLWKISLELYVPAPDKNNYSPVAKAMMETLREIYDGSPVLKTGYRAGDHATYQFAVGNSVLHRARM